MQLGLSKHYGHLYNKIYLKVAIPLSIAIKEDIWLVKRFNCLITLKKFTKDKIGQKGQYATVNMYKKLQCKAIVFTEIMFNIPSNMKMPSYQYRDKTLMQPFYLYNGNFLYCWEDIVILNHPSSRGSNPNWDGDFTSACCWVSA